jgi:solute:Na+ symporter, SSS family
MDRLGLIDILVLVAYLASAILVGFLASRKAKNLEAYVLGDRDLPWWAILGSIVAAETSAATVLSVPGEASGVPGTATTGTGMAFLQLALGYIVGRAIIVQVLLPLYFRGKLLTAYEVLDQRFGGLTKQAASLLFLVTRNLGDGLRLFLAAIPLFLLAGDVSSGNKIQSLAACIILMGVVTTLYTLVGGLRSVIWNDCIQFGVYIAGSLAAVLVIAGQIDGGWQEIWRYATEHDKFRVFDFTPSIALNYTFWSGVIGGAVLAIGTHGTDHMMVQRYLSARSQAEASRALLASGFVVFLQFVLFLFIGVELATFYAQHPEVEFARADEVFSRFIVDQFPPGTGLIGLMLAAVLASALSSSLSAVASAVVNDFYVPAHRTPPSSRRQLVLNRWLIVVFGAVQTLIGIGFALWTTDPTSTVVKTALAIAGFAFGLLLGVFALGVLTRRAGQWDALIGAAVGLCVLAFVQFGLPLLAAYKYVPPETKVGYPWLALIGAGTTFLVGWLTSLFHPSRGTAA